MTNFFPSINAVIEIMEFSDSVDRYMTQNDAIIFIDHQESINKNFVKNLQECALSCPIFVLCDEKIEINYLKHNGYKTCLILPLMKKAVYDLLSRFLDTDFIIYGPKKEKKVSVDSGSGQEDHVFIQKMKVLNVDDDSSLRMCISRGLNQISCNISCTEAQNGEEAISFTKKETFDAVLVNIDMQGDVTGESTCAIMRLYGYTAPIYGIVNEVPSCANMKSLKAFGLDGAIARPLLASALAEVVDKIQRSKDAAAPRNDSSGSVYGSGSGSDSLSGSFTSREIMTRIEGKRRNNSII